MRILKKGTGFHPAPSKHGISMQFQNDSRGED